MTRGTWLFLIAFMIAFIGGGGRAATADQAWPDCNSRVADRSISGCSLILARGERVPRRDRVRALNNRGFAYTERGGGSGSPADYDRAIADLDEAIGLEPSYVTAYTNRGDAFEAKGVHDRARADYDEAIRLDPNHAVAYRQRGIARLDIGDYDGAIADIDEALRLAPKISNEFMVIDAYVYRGRAYKAKGEVDRANADFDRANQLLKPVDARARNLMCANYGRKGEYDTALADCDKALQLDPKMAAVHANFCWIYREKGEFDRAIGECDQALRLQRVGRAYYHRGLAYEKKGDLDRALADLDTYRELIPADSVEGPAAEARIRQALADRQMAANTPVPQDTPNAPASAMRPERRIALVIGNAHYRSVDFLANPERDAASVAQALTRAGYEVTAKNDLTYDGLRQTLTAFADEAAKSDWAIVYYAGHGMEIGGTNYLVPVDAKILKDTAVAFEAMSLSSVREALSSARKLHLIILDACRENPFGTRMQRMTATRAVTRGLARPAETDEPGDLIVYAAKEGQLAEDGIEGANSPFAAAFIKELAGPRVQIREMFDAVSDDVNAATDGRQRPILYGRLPARQSFFIRAP